ncbi:hypothetical protein FEM03_08515 [Phragmitibacter flavus]|uniref:Protein kinase domain-containing protein n=1 Tax=Phragmitibacter flavus TaxID=2576071 RepID=A0A5R8KF94_9BACT|nr:serine/threonine-protein kinase [Phragmitibacter flavus]TLD70952.1 hypothetical protein FEM03_08515 [Phragmitibacter flavus]
MASAQQPDSFEPPSLAELAAMLPRYEVCDFIAQGGMGAVYLARQASLERHVAVKVLPPMPEGEVDFAGHMTREARSMARLTHNNIAAVHDFGVTDDGWFYLVMEFVDGDTLHNIIRLNRLTVPKVKSIALQLCDALIFAHEHGILHRDIKPSNILINQEGRVKVVDFGLSRPMAAQEDEVALGTPDYVAPEIMDGGRVDHRADVYALGIVIFEMLTGRVPWHDGRKTCALLPDGGAWNEVVQKATHENPDQRFRDVREMRAAILKATSPRREAHLPRTASGRLMDMGPPPVVKRSSGFGLLVLSSIVMLAGLAAWLWWQQEQAKQPKPVPGIMAVEKMLSTGGGVRDMVDSISTKLGEVLEGDQVATGTVVAEVVPEETLELAKVPAGHVSQMQEGHEDVITGVAIFPDQRRAATSSSDGTVRIWDVVRGVTILKFGPFENGMQRVAVSPDGKFVAAGSGHQMLRVWDATSGELVNQTASSGREVTGLAFSEDGRWLLSACTEMGASLRAWPWQDGGKRRAVLDKWGKIVNALALAPGGGKAQRFFTVGGGRDQQGISMELWMGDLQEAAPLKRLQARPMVPSRVAVSKDGALVAFTQGNRLLVVDVESDRDVASCVGHEGMVESMQFLEGGRFLLSSAQDKTIRIWEVMTGKEVFRMESETFCTSHVAVSADEQWLLSGGGMRWGSPPQKDGDFALHVWRLPKLGDLESEAGRLVRARREFEKLEVFDPDLASLRSSLAGEWASALAKAGSANPALALADLEAKYLAALQRAVPSLRGTAREAYLGEISRVTNKLRAPAQAAVGWPESLKGLFGIYLTQSAKLREEPGKILAAERNRQLAVIGEMVRTREAGEPMALARARLVQEEVVRRGSMSGGVGQN